MPKAFLLKRYIKPETEAEKKPRPGSTSNGRLDSSWTEQTAPKNQDLFYFLSNTTGIADVQDNSSFVSQAPFGLTSGAEKKLALPAVEEEEEEEEEGMTEVDTSLESNQLAKPQKKSPGTSSAQSGPVKPPYKCEQCGKVFKTKYTLTIHLKMPSHTGARPFVCGVCGKGFRLSSTLCRHKIIHTTEKPHKCSICHKAFNRSSTLKTHLRTHSEAKEFRCELCGKGFHQKGNLRNHILIHTGEKPYRCSLCEKAFNKLSNLKFHLHVHTDNAPYRCRYCKVHFSRRCDLKEHISASHKSI